MSDPPDHLSDADPDADQSAQDPLLPVVQSDVLPCLHAKYGPVGASAHSSAGRGEPSPTLQDHEIGRFADALLASDINKAWTLVEQLRARGASAEWIVVDMFGAGARALGVRWEDDLNDFTQITIAMSHLTAMLRKISGEFVGTGRFVSAQCRMLLAPAPGEQHSFGLAIASEFFLRSGFEVHTYTSSTLNSLVDAIRADSFSVVGLSMGAIANRDSLSETIRRLRSVSRNRAVAIVVGGAIFDKQPELCHQVGADMHVRDIREGPVRVMKLVNLMARRYRES